MKILVIKPSSLGDVIHALRVMRQYKLAYPAAQIHWVIKAGLEGILESVQWIDRLYIYKRSGGLIEYFKLILKIRKFEYDYCLDLQGLLRSALLAGFSKSRNKFGRADGRELSTLFYKSVGESSRKKQIHAIDRLLPFLGILGLQKHEENLPLEFPPPETKKKPNKIPSGCIMIFPESRRSEKVWPYFLELADWIKQNCQQPLVIAGNYPDNSYKNCIDIRGSTKLRDLPFAISQASLVISNDSAPLHIASAVGAKIIALFGPTEPERYGPYPSIMNETSCVRSTSYKIEDIEFTTVKNAIQRVFNSEF